MRTESFKGVLLSTLLIASLMSPLLLISVQVVWGQEIGWTRQFGTSDNDYAFIVTVDASGNVYVAGETDGTLPGQSSSGWADAFVRKYDGSGNELWTRQFGTSARDYARGAAVDASGNVYVAGWTEGALPGQSFSGLYDAFVRKYDGSGNELWTRQFGTSLHDFVESVAVDTSGNVYVAGETLGALPGQSSAGTIDAFVRKYDGSGNELWTRQFGTFITDHAWGVAVDSFGNIYVAGETDGTLPGQSSSGGRDAFVRKYDGSGNELWTRQFGTYDRDKAEDVAVDSFGNIYVAGETDGTLPGQSSAGIPDVFVRKYDGSGNELWTRQFGSDASDEASSVMADTSGNVYVVGSTGKGGALPGQTSAGELDAFIRKYDGSGNELWTRQFGTSDWDWTRGVAVDTSGDVYVSGWTYGALPGQISADGGDAFLVKFVDVKPLTRWPLIAGIVGVIVMIGIVAALYMRRRKPREAMFGSDPIHVSKQKCNTSHFADYRFATQFIYCLRRFLPKNSIAIARLLPNLST